ncbi:MAG TPA: DUF3261 domain-containing protein [Psychromonas hadalis]|nr:DUF3261 domain-containing protein [Psychromonas hadalis]
MKFHPIIIFLSAILLSACSMVQGDVSVKVEVAKDVFLTLPKPNQLEKNIDASQLISATWGEQKEQSLLVQLQADQQKVVLAGFSAWGAKLLSLDYSGDKIETYVLSGFSDTLPKPQQILFNVMLSLWPTTAWQPELDKIGWQLTEQPLQRTLIDEKGNVIITINYENEAPLAGLITLKHHTLNYIITIKTNN